jgi:uncharacterized membrane protein YhaH (DUF805 family)
MRKFLAPYFSLKGRSSRREWWIIEILILFGFRLNEAAFEAMATGGGRFDLGAEASQTWMILAATLLWLNIASNVRRLHDRGKSGWWSLIYLIPGIGQLWCFIECGFLKGQPHANRYGPPSGSVSAYQSLTDQLAARLRILGAALPVPTRAPKAGAGLALARAVPTARSAIPAAAPAQDIRHRAAVLTPASHRPTVQRATGTLLLPRSRKLSVALAVGAAVAVVPVGVNQNLPVFESIDKTLKP